jgi:hypothetical protein
MQVGEMRNAYKILVRKPEEKRSVGRAGRRWEDNIKIDRRNMVNFIHLAQYRGH